MGGFFMHSRTGLKTEYLGDTWFDMINACADEAERLGMEAWFYDEDRWPSGFAGGLVTRHPEYRAQKLVMHAFGPGEFEAREDYMALFSCRMDGNDCYEATRISAAGAAEANQERCILAFFVQQSPQSAFYNGYTDVDRMNREATDAFIKFTHEEYRERCGERLGASIHGIFLDEPHRQTVLDTPVPIEQSFEDGISVPWTDRLPDAFSERMGYSILDELPALFLNPEGKEVSSAKWDYIEVTQQLFIENWLRPIYDWCERNNMKLTGHLL